MAGDSSPVDGSALTHASGDATDSTDQWTPQIRWTEAATNDPRFTDLLTEEDADLYAFAFSFSFRDRERVLARCRELQRKDDECRRQHLCVAAGVRENHRLVKAIFGPKKKEKKKKKPIR